MWGSAVAQPVAPPGPRPVFGGHRRHPKVVSGRFRRGQAARRGEGCEGLQRGLRDVCGSRDRGVGAEERAEPSCPFPGPFSSPGKARGCFATYSPAEEVQGLRLCHSCKRWCLLCFPYPARVPVPASPKRPQELIRICSNSELSRSDSKFSCFDL